MLYLRMMSIHFRAAQTSTAMLGQDDWNYEEESFCCRVEPIKNNFTLRFVILFKGME